MKLHGHGLTWDLQIWHGRQYVKICCPRALLGDEGRHGDHDYAVEVVREPDTYVRVIHDHDLGDCDEAIQRLL